MRLGSRTSLAKTVALVLVAAAITTASKSGIAKDNEKALKDMTPREELASLFLIIGIDPEAFFKDAEYAKSKKKADDLDLDLGDLDNLDDLDGKGPKANNRIVYLLGQLGLDTPVSIEDRLHNALSSHHHLSPRLGTVFGSFLDIYYKQTPETQELISIQAPKYRLVERLERYAVNFV
ncbi:hypothetical protein H4219_000036 [Mycoemilia scoparia]|uniref:Uncharacterized protein n=1 Tax=Mycoemilia scoparia TaxID=417184 RepID=A0A9W8A4C0_9FUNG|nr:hypothetical protein H4219_000036 [Mycoemilia scoparia]